MRRKRVDKILKLLTVSVAVIISGFSCSGEKSSGCGDLVCDDGENALNCPSDCESVCGDGICSEEDFQSCHQDCIVECEPLVDITDLVASNSVFYGYESLGIYSAQYNSDSATLRKEIVLVFRVAQSSSYVISTMHPGFSDSMYLELLESSCNGTVLNEGTAIINSYLESDKTYALRAVFMEEDTIFALDIHKEGICETEDILDISSDIMTGLQYDVDCTYSGQVGSCTEVSGSEGVVRFSPPKNGLMIASVVHPDTDFPSDIYVRESGDGIDYCSSSESEIVCSSTNYEDINGSTVVFDASVSGIYNIFIDGCTESQSCSAVLTVGYAVDSGMSLGGCSHEINRDLFAFYAPAFSVIDIHADTVDAETAADLRMMIKNPDGTDLHESDDEVPCTFPPPDYQCPEYSFTSQNSGLYLVEVYVGTSQKCADFSLVNYVLNVTVDGMSPELFMLIKDF
ncbi:MAG: hypothetical protein JXR95_16030 [Deltaproteobacteria bacterium]|nr:hypothetical protein [Deltaproteobacteria bacterium]